MSFNLGCSCRVWAIDGWVNDGQATNVNNNIVALGTMLFTENYAGTHDQKVTQFLPARMSAATTHNCIIYGEFEYQADVTPTHMWMEYLGYIYDTIPGNPLCRVIATATNRRHPPSGALYNANQIGSVNYYLSQAQETILNNAAGNWTAAVLPSGRAIEIFNP